MQATHSSSLLRASTFPMLLTVVLPTTFPALVSSEQGHPADCRIVPARHVRLEVTTNPTAP